jgi:hypothetical protein
MMKERQGNWHVFVHNVSSEIGEQFPALETEAGAAPSCVHVHV